MAPVEDLCARHAVSDHDNNGCHGESQVPDARHSRHLVGLGGDPVESLLPSVVLARCEHPVWRARRKDSRRAALDFSGRDRSPRG